MVRERRPGRPSEGDTVVVPMKERHLVAVRRIEELTNPRPWSEALFASELRQHRSRGVVAVERGSVVVGFGFMMSSGDEGHITSLAVDPQARRRSIGSQILAALLDEVRRFGHDAATLEVRASNDAAIGLYEGFGFERSGVRPKYYAEGVHGPEDALIMWARGLARSR